MLGNSSTVSITSTVAASGLHDPVKSWAGFAQSEGRDVGALLTAPTSNRLVSKGEGGVPLTLWPAPSDGL